MTLRLMAGVVVLGLFGCGPTRYGGVNCESVALGADVTSRPEASAPTAFASFTVLRPGGYIHATPDFDCCAGKQAASCATDCETLRQSLRQVSLTGKYVSEGCGNYGGATTECTVAVDAQGRAVAVYTFCAD